MMSRRLVVCVAVCVFGFHAFNQPPAIGGLTFNGQPEYEIDSLNYFYTITGGKFVNGQQFNGDNASGGVFRFLLDDPGWGYPMQKWNRDDWFVENAGLALTLYNGTTVVFDNNGIEDGSYGNYYDNLSNPGNPTPGLYRGYSMANNYDWIYAGYFKLNEPTTITKIVGYFDGDGADGQTPPFNPNDPLIRYAVNIWSSVEGTGDDAGYLMPKLTGGFYGDVLSSETIAGTAFTSGAFSVSNTGVTRKFYDADSNLLWEDPIWRVVYTLDTPYTLQAGEYFFGVNAQIVPEPASVIVWGLLGAVAFAGTWVLRRRS